MAIYPDMATKLRAEVLDHCGPHRAPTYDNIRNMKYSTCMSRIDGRALIYVFLVRAVINEVLRLYPPVPLNVRESRAEACTLPTADASYAIDDERPFYMPGGTTIMYLPLLMQRNPALWGPDADIFDPERWLHPDRVAQFVSNPTMYAPFSAGPRIVNLLLFTSTQALTEDGDTVHWAELRLQRGIVFPSAVAAGVRHVHSGTRVSACGVATPPRVEIPQRPAGGREDLAGSGTHSICQGLYAGNSVRGYI
jgi:hypothetical protein